MNADTDANGQTDALLRDNMIDAVEIVKGWALRGSQKLGDTLSKNPFTGTETKKVVNMFLSKDYETKAASVKRDFDVLTLLDGPIGGDSTDPNRMFDASDAWAALANDPDVKHWENFVRGLSFDFRQTFRFQVGSRISDNCLLLVDYCLSLRGGRAGRPGNRQDTK